MKDKVVIPEIKKTHKILLAIGLVCIIVGILLQIFLINKSKIDFAVIRSIVITFLGATILYFACLKKDSMWRYLLGLFLTLGGFFFALIDTCFENHDIKTLWPILVSLAGISIIFSAVFSKKRITFSIIFPSVIKNLTNKGGSKTAAFMVETKRIELSTLRMRTVRSPS